MKNSKVNILLVEDNPDDELLTLIAFEENNIPNNIIVAHDGKEALDYLFINGISNSSNKMEFPEIILLDLNLPRVDGLEVLKRIRSHDDTRLLPVIILTSSKEEADIMKSYELGANSYIQKPVDFNQFTEAIRQLSRYWLVLNESPITKKQSHEKTN
jgi:two-component system, response regulator